MPAFDPSTKPTLDLLPLALLKLVESSDLPGLSEEPSQSALREYLCSGNLQTDLEDHSSFARQLCECGLWLLAGDLERSHSLSQDIGEPEGSFWHGIMHRREHDFGNAKYWFRRVGQHPVFDQIALHCGVHYEDPFSFVDKCSQAIRATPQHQIECVNVQWYEWQALMAHCLTR